MRKFACVHSVDSYFRLANKYQDRSRQLAPS